MARGYFEIGICNGKTPSNLGTLWRSAYQLGAAGIFTVGRRYKPQCSDTCQAPRHIPLREFDHIGAFLPARPRGCCIVAVEMGGSLLADFEHPKRALYMLGAEDSGLSEEALGVADHIVSIEAVRVASFNVAVAGSIVMHDRLIKGRTA